MVSVEELDKRDARALTESMTVLPDGGSMFQVVGENGRTHTVDARENRCTCRDAEYNLPTEDGRETCKHRARVAFAAGERAIPAWVDMDRVDDLLGEQLPNAEVRIAATDGGFPEWAAETGVLGSEQTVIRCQTCGAEGETVQEHEHRDGCPEPDDELATDGGVGVSPSDRKGSSPTKGTSTDRVRVPVAGGVLVYEDEPDELGRRLVGFEDVESFTDLRTALAARGIGVGAMHHKPVLDDSDRRGGF